MSKYVKIQKSGVIYWIDSACGALGIDLDEDSSLQKQASIVYDTFSGTIFKNTINSVKDVPGLIDKMLDGSTVVSYRQSPPWLTQKPSWDY